MKRKWMTLVLTLCMVLSLTPTARADFNAATVRHGVVQIEEGYELNGSYIGLATGSGFFTGTSENDPQFIVTNNHMIALFTILGSGESNRISFSSWMEIMMFDWLGVTTQQEYNTYYPILESMWKNRYVGNSSYATIKSYIRINFDSNDYSEGYLVERDEIRDVALLKLSRPTDKRASLPISIPNQDMVGKSVHCVGFPGVSDNSAIDPVSVASEEDASFTVGNIGRLIVRSGNGTNAIQTDAEIFSGNSGGPMILDENGAVIGINSWSVTSSGQTEYYAISMEDIKPMLDRNNIPYELKEYGSAAADVTYTLTLDNGEGVENARLEDANADGSATFTLPVAPTREGYTFQGWAESAGGSAAYQPGAQITLNDSAKTLYAVWEQNAAEQPAAADVTYTLTLDNGEGVENARLEDANAAGSATFTLPVAPTREGYTFQGWAESAGGSAAYQPGAQITLNDSAKTLYAVWASAGDVNHGGLPAWAIAAIAAAVIAIAAAVLFGLKKKKTSTNNEIIKPTDPAPSADTGWRVQGVSGALEGKRFMLRSSGTILMGRDPQAGICFPMNTAGVSGRHCELWYENGSVYLRDVGSSNGTFVSGVRVEAQKDVRLREGELFWLGSESEKFVLQKKG